MRRVTGIDVQEWGSAAFTWTDAEGNKVELWEPPPGQ